MAIRWTILIIIDVLLAVFVLYVAEMVRFGPTEVAEKLLDTDSLLASVIFVGAVLFSSYLMETYNLGKNSKRREVLINTLLGAITSFALLSILYYLNPDFMLGRGVLIISITLFVLFQFLWHVVYLIGFNNPRFSQRVLILGSGSLANQIGELAASNDRNFTLAGYVTCDSGGVSKPDVSPNDILGSADDLMETATHARADMIVVALSERRGIFPLRDVLRCKLNGIEILDAPSFYELSNGKLMLEQITPGWFIFSSGFRRTALISIFKRGIDIVLSAVGLLMTAPFFPLLALIIKLDSPGQLFFRQVRVGNREKAFNLYKFRTMCANAEEKTGAIWSMENDNRVTRTGRFLRNSRIDEIPQLYNVLKGEMSFIGPRPERPEFVEKLKQVIPFYSKRHFIKPGLTGWAQVRYPYGSSVEDAVEKLRYDLYYVKNLSLFLETLIFFETIKVVLFGRGGR